MSHEKRPPRLPRLELCAAPGSAAAPVPAGGVVWTDPSGEPIGWAASEGGWHRIQLDRIASFEFEARSGVVSAVPLAEGPRGRIEESFRRLVLPYVLQLEGLGVLHASAVRKSRGVVAICGAAGAGKSTLACALALRGHRPWADDAVAFRLLGGRALSRALPFRLRLHRDAAEFLGVPPARPHHPDPTAEAELRAAVVLEVAGPDDTGSRIELVRLSPDEAFRALLPHAYCHDSEDPAQRRPLVEMFLALSAFLPVFSLCRPRSLERLAELCTPLEALI